MTAILRGRLILFGISIISVIGAQSASEQCYPCNEVKRVWSSVFCEKDFNDCGDCYHGYQENEARECVLQTDKEIDPNKPVRIRSRSTIILRCQGQDISNCNWARKDREGEPVEIKGRYQGIGVIEKNCSLKIADFQEIDARDWICRGDGKFQNKHVTRWSLYLGEPEIVYVNENEVKLVPFNQSVVLNCYSKASVSCSWSRRGFPVEINCTVPERYKCVDQNRSGQEATECSLRIDRFQELDVGTWQCQYTSKAFLGAPIELRMPVRPANQTANIGTYQSEIIGNNMTLNCGYDARVNCGWERNGRIIPVEGRYQYVIGGKGSNTTNCSLAILSLAPEDNGVWRCGYKYKQMTHYKMTSSTSLLVVQEKNTTEVVTSTPGKVTEGLNTTPCDASPNNSKSSHLGWAITSTALLCVLAGVVVYRNCKKMHKKMWYK